jgi:hypothetical protein
MPRLTPSWLKPLTIRPRTRTVPGSMLRLLVTLLPTVRSAMLSRRDLLSRNWPPPTTPHPEDGHREFLGRAPHPRGTALPRLRGLRAQRLALLALPASRPEGWADLDNVPPEPPRRHSRHGLLLRSHGDVPYRADADQLPEPLAECLRGLLDSFIDHYNLDRTHLGLGKDSPLGRSTRDRHNTDGRNIGEAQAVRVSSGAIRIRASDLTADLCRRSASPAPPRRIWEAGVAPDDRIRLTFTLCQRGLAWSQGAETAACHRRASSPAR